MKLTEKQKGFLNYLKDYFSREGQAPSLRVAAAELGVSHTAVAQLQTQYAPEVISEPVQPREMVTPEQLYSPAVAQEEQTMALA